MRKNSPRANKTEPTAPKVLSRYLRAPTGSCHDHCKCETKQPNETKPINSFHKRIPKPPVDRTKVDAAQPVIQRIKKAPSVVPKSTTRNLKNSNVVKDQILKKDVFKYSNKKSVAIEPKSKDSKPKSENSQASTTSRRHSDVFLPISETTTHPSSRFSKRRLSEMFVHQAKDVVSVSKVSMVRGSSVIKNESRKDSKLPLVGKRCNSLKPSVSSPKRGAKVPPLTSFRSLPKPELKVSRKLNPSKPIKEIVQEKFPHVIEPSKPVVEEVGIETTKIRMSPDSCSSSDEKVMDNGQNDQLHEHSPSDNTSEIDGQNNGNEADLEVSDTEEVTQVENLVVETRESQTDLEVNDTKEVTQVENLVVETREESQEDSEVNDTKLVTHFENIVVETRDCSPENMEFRRGTILSPRSENSSPRKLDFRKGKELDDDQTVDVETKILRRMSCDGVVRVPESHTVSVDLKHQEMEEKVPLGLINNVIEETASKLIQVRKSKVQALVGAFENIVSSKNQAL